MAFKQANLTKISNLLNLAAVTDVTPGYYAYATTDTIATVAGAGYFNGALGLQAHSVIDVYASNGKATFIASSVSAAGVVVSANNATMARGAHTTVAATDTIVTGLAGPLLGVVVTSNDDASLANFMLTASLGDQAGTPASGSFLLNSWKGTDGTHPTPIAATAFGVKMSWLAWSAATL